MFHFLQALLVALAVAIDAATVAACEGISRGCKHSWGTLATIALLFGVLQGGVTAIGYCVGAEMIDLVDEYDHFIYSCYRHCNGFSFGLFLLYGLQNPFQMDLLGRIVWGLGTYRYWSESAR